MTRIKRYGAIGAFFVIGPAMTELLTGNIPLATLLDPIAISALSISYGGAALLVRETVIRWGKGFPSIVVLGIAYGMVNEALESGGYFDPKFYSVIELGLENYGRWHGVNVLWALGITAFHAIFSITIPIIVVDSLFRTKGRLLGKPALGFLFVLWIAGAVFLMFVSNHIFSPRPPPDAAALAFIIVSIIALTAAARILPRVTVSASKGEPRPVILFVVALAGSAAFFFAYLGLHHHLLDPLLNIAALVGLLLLYAGLLLRVPGISHKGKVALAAGAEGPLLFSAIRGGLILQAGIAIAILIGAWLRSGTKPQDHRASVDELQSDTKGGAGPAGSIQ